MRSVTFHKSIPRGHYGIDVRRSSHQTGQHGARNELAVKVSPACESKVAQAELEENRGFGQMGENSKDGLCLNPSTSLEVWCSIAIRRHSTEQDGDNSTQMKSLSNKEWQVHGENIERKLDHAHVSHICHLEDPSCYQSR